MRRRDLIKGIAGSTISWPLAAVAQIAKVRQIGLLSPFTRSDAAPWNQAFLKGLRDLGWIDGKNIAFEVAAKGPGIATQSVEIRSTGDLEKNFAVIAKARFNALAIMPNPVFVTNPKSIADFAMQNRLQSMFHLREFVDVGGLVSYGVDRSDLYRRAATYVDKILKGASPADLPIEQPTKFDLAINVRTAKALGLTVPPSLRVLADEVIE